MLPSRPSRWPLVVAVLVLLAVACGGDSDTGATPEPLPASTDAISSTTAGAPNTTSAVPAPAVQGPDEPWDLLFIGFNDLITELPAERYAELAAEELGVDIALTVVPGFDHVFASHMVVQLRGERYPPLDDLVREAEIIALVTRPGMSEGGVDQHIHDDFEACFWYPGPDNAPRDRPPEYWDPYRETLDDVYAEILSLRQGAATTLITFDFYNPSLPQQREAGTDAACAAWFEEWSARVAEAAATNGSGLVSLHDLFNGPDHLIDPAERGLIGPTDAEPRSAWYRVTPAGADVIAQALADVGFEPHVEP